MLDLPKSSIWTTLGSESFILTAFSSGRANEVICSPVRNGFGFFASILSPVEGNRALFDPEVPADIAESLVPRRFSLLWYSAPFFARHRRWNSLSIACSSLKEPWEWLLVV